MSASLQCQQLPSIVQAAMVHPLRPPRKLVWTYPRFKVFTPMPMVIPSSTHPISLKIPSLKILPSCPRQYRPKLSSLVPSCRRLYRQFKLTLSTLKARKHLYEKKFADQQLHYAHLTASNVKSMNDLTTTIAKKSSWKDRSPLS